MNGTDLSNLPEFGSMPPQMSQPQQQPMMQQPMMQQPMMQQSAPQMQSFAPPMMQQQSQASQRVVPFTEALAAPSLEEVDDIAEEQNPTFEFFDLSLDVDTTIVILGGILVWALIWYQSGLMKRMSLDPLYMFIFSVFVLYQLLNVVTSSAKSGSSAFELNVLMSVEQMISILFGTLVVFTLFSDRLNLHPETQNMLRILSVDAILMLTVASMWLNVSTSGRSFRAIRKAKQMLYNIALALFVLGCILILKARPMVELQGRM